MIPHRARNWWLGLAHRERTMITIAVAVVLIGLLYSIGIEPAWKTRSRLAIELPRLQTELVQLEALQAEAHAFGSRKSSLVSGESLRIAVEQSVARANIVARAASEGANAVSVSAKNVSAAAWFVWLEKFSRESRAAMISLSAQRSQSAGKIDAQVTFQLSGTS